MAEKYVMPEFKLRAFNCPSCDAYAAQLWSAWNNGDIKLLRMQSGVAEQQLYCAECRCCGQYSYWYNRQLIYPPNCSAPMPADDMPDDCKDLYEEARNIADKSPRGAAALLRLCLQMLMPHLEEKGKNINEDIASLVKQHKIPEEIQKALDICRVVGNNAVHPGEIAIDDNPQIVSSLFKLLNIIVEKTISQPKEINALYTELPQAAQQAIAKRDKT